MKKLKEKLQLGEKMLNKLSPEHKILFQTLFKEINEEILKIEEFNKKTSNYVTLRDVIDNSNNTIDVLEHNKFMDYSCYMDQDGDVIFHCYWVEDVERLVDDFEDLMEDNQDLTEKNLKDLKFLLNYMQENDINFVTF